MSDCANGGRNVYRIPEERQPNVLYAQGHPNVDYSQIEAIEVDGQRFERRKKAWKVIAEECDHRGASVRYLACSECCAPLAEEDCTGESDGPLYCSDCGAEILGTLRCPKCGEVMFDLGGGGWADCTCGYVHDPYHVEEVSADD